MESASCSELAMNEEEENPTKRTQEWSVDREGWMAKVATETTS
jgi:hypothetical protein